VDNFRHIFQDAEVKLVFVTGKDLYHKIQDILPLCPTVSEVFCIEKTEGLRNLSDLQQAGNSSLDAAQIEALKDAILPGDLATIIYTSGTTGIPKGVMLSHANIISNFVTLADDILPKGVVHRALSFLPLCHIYERVLNYMYQYLGISVYYSETIEAVAQNLKEVRPEMFCAVPRVIEKFYDKIIARGRSLTGIKKLIFFWAVGIANHYELYGGNSAYYKMKHRLAEKLIFSKWREALGGNIKIIVSGGASLQARLSRVFWAAGIEVMEGYGLTETSPVIAVSNFEIYGVKIGTVGPVLPGVTLKFTEDGEICCKGPNVMMGYYKQPEATREVIDAEGWFHTGDIGILVDNMYVKITDRKKEIFKTSGGKFIAPQPLENKLKESPFIENVMVVGENRAYPVALIVPAFDTIRNWAVHKGIPDLKTQAAIAESGDVLKRIQKEINALNHNLDKTEQIKKIKLLDHDWTPETGELSMTLKLRRKHLCERYTPLIEELY
jgi:long-chain acyl-CoA synthetase